MNKTMNKLSLGMLTAAALAVGCKGDQEGKIHYTNKVFISSAAYTNDVRIEDEDREMSRDIIIGMAMPEGFDVTATFRAAPELVDTYRAAYYNPEVALLPTGHYDLSAATATIREGRVTSDPLTLDFTNLDQLDLETDYVLPVTISSVNGVGVLESAKTLYYVFKESSLINVVADMNENRAWPGPDDWNDPAPVTDMGTFTLEALIFGRAWDNTDSNLSTIMGIEDTFLIRVGDAQIPSNQLQVAYGIKYDDTTDRGSVTNTALQLNTGQWYHVAVTFDEGLIVVYLDGREITTGDSSDIGLTSVNFGVEHSDEDEGKPRCFWVGYSYDKERYLNGLISEVRIWNKALTEEEINSDNHFYRVDPESAGLVAYWKFDEGTGSVVKDHTAYGNDLTSETTLQWVEVSLPEKVK